MEEARNKIEDMLDEAIIQNPGEFPSGAIFTDTVLDYLHNMKHDGEVDGYSVNPWDERGLVVRVWKGSEEIEVVRAPDGGRQQ